MPTAFNIYVNFNDFSKPQDGKKSSRNPYFQTVNAVSSLGFKFQVFFTFGMDAIDQSVKFKILQNYPVHNGNGKLKLSATK